MKIPRFFWSNKIKQNKEQSNYQSCPEETKRSKLPMELLGKKYMRIPKQKNYGRSKEMKAVSVKDANYRGVGERKPAVATFYRKNQRKLQDDHYIHLLE